jgi:hypothetical protein
MPSILNEALEWLDRAEQAREVAAQLTDPGARKAVRRVSGLSRSRSLPQNAKTFVRHRSGPRPSGCAFRGAVLAVAPY